MLGIHLDPRSFLDRIAAELGRIDANEIRSLADAIFECYRHQRLVFVCGNGGSGSNSSHFSEDLGKSTLLREDFDNDRKKRLRIISLTDNTPYILAWGNDEGFERDLRGAAQEPGWTGRSARGHQRFGQQSECAAGRRVG